MIKLLKACLKAAWHRTPVELESYLGPLDVPLQISLEEVNQCERLRAYRLLEDVWVLGRGEQSEAWVEGRILGVMVGSMGRPFYLVGYWDEVLETYEMVPYRGPIRRIPVVERDQPLKLVKS